MSAQTRPARQAVSGMCPPSWSIRPISSASSMNWSGAMNRSTCHHLASASTQAVSGGRTAPRYRPSTRLRSSLGLTTRQLKSMTASYPSVGSDLGSML